MKYTRVFSGDKGESHFEDVVAEFSSVAFAPPATPLDITPFESASRYGFLRAPAGWYGDWHPAPQRQILCYLAGEIEAETSDGEVRRFGAGSITLVDDISGKGHRSRVIGSESVLAKVVPFEE